jgi:hypothetical protein
MGQKIYKPRRVYSIYYDVGTLAAPLALLRAEIVLKRDNCSGAPPLSSKKCRPYFGYI